jgi:hypothetical protein
VAVSASIVRLYWRILFQRRGQVATLTTCRHSLPRERGHGPPSIDCRVGIPQAPLGAWPTLSSASGCPLGPSQASPQGASDSEVRAGPWVKVPELSPSGGNATASLIRGLGTSAMASPLILQTPSVRSLTCSWRRPAGVASPKPRALPYLGSYPLLQAAISPPPQHRATAVVPLYITLNSPVTIAKQNQIQTQKYY